MKKKVLQLIHGFTMGGAETLVKEYCLKLDKEKYEISVLCFYRYHTPYEKMLEDAGIQITYINDIRERMGKTGIRQIRVLLELIRRYFFIKNHIKRESPDILHTHLAVNSYVLFANPKKSTKIFHTVHNEPTVLWDKRKSRRIDLWAVRKLIKKYPMRFITLHEEMCREVNDMFGVRDSLVLNNGIDFTRFEKATEKEQIRKREGIPVDAYVVGHVGRFNHQKNHKFLVEVFSKIKAQKEEAYLLLVGNGSLQTETEMMLKRMGLEESYKILSNRTDIPDLMNAMDVFVFPSKFEGLGIVLIEAQKMGVKCIVSDRVPRAATVSNLVKTLNLNLPPEKWAEETINFDVRAVEYSGIKEWDINCVVRRLESFYES